MKTIRSFPGTPRFDEKLIKSACKNGDLDAIKELASAVAGALRRRESSGTPAAVTAGGHISDSQAKNFAYRMIRACHDFGHPPPMELVELIQLWFEQDRPPRGVNRQPSDKLRRASDFQRVNPSASAAQIAQGIGAHRVTVQKWISNGKLRRPVADKE